MIYYIKHIKLLNDHHFFLTEKYKNCFNKRKWKSSASSFGCDIFSDLLRFFHQLQIESNFIEFLRFFDHISYRIPSYVFNVFPIIFIRYAWIFYGCTKIENSLEKDILRTDSTTRTCIATVKAWDKLSLCARYIHVVDGVRF